MLWNIVTLCDRFQLCTICFSSVLHIKSIMLKAKYINRTHVNVIDNNIYFRTHVNIINTYIKQCQYYTHVNVINEMVRTYINDINIICRLTVNYIHNHKLR